MTMRELFLQLEEEEGEPIYLLRTLLIWLSGLRLEHLVDHEFEADEAPAFYFSCAKLLDQLWEEVLSLTDTRLTGMDDFTDEEVLEECNRVISKLRDGLSLEFDILLPAYKIKKGVKN